jgi:hypothetical protein
MNGTACVQKSYLSQEYKHTYCVVDIGFLGQERKRWGGRRQRESDKREEAGGRKGEGAGGREEG